MRGGVGATASCVFMICPASKKDSAMGLFKSPKIPERSKPIVRTQADLAQEQKDDYSKRFRARQQTLLSESAAPASTGQTQKKTLLGG